MKKNEKNENVSREKIVEKESLPFNKGWGGRSPKKNVKKKIKEERVSAENLKRFKEEVENAFHDDFFKVMRDAAEMKYPLKVAAEIVCAFVKYGRGQEVEEERFVKSYEGTSLGFTITALKSMAEAVRTDGKAPILWSIGDLCRR